jgi:hypothetical protein
MDTYYAYKWIPWQLFCSKTKNVSGTYCLASSPFSGTDIASKGTPFSSTMGLDGLRFTAANQKAGIYLRSIPNLDINSDIRLAIEFYLDAASVAVGNSMSLTMNYAAITSGPGGTNLYLAPATTAITVPTVTVANPEAIWHGRMYTLADPGMTIPARTLTSQSQSIYVEVGTSASPGVLVTSSIAVFMGLGIYYTSSVMAN